LHPCLPKKGAGASLVAGYHSLGPVGLYAGLAEGEEKKGEDTYEGESCEDAGMLAKAMAGKMI